MNTHKKQWPYLLIPLLIIIILSCSFLYLKNLYFSYYNRPESDDIKELIFYMLYLSDIESESISKFTTLSEKTKLSILSYI